MELGGNSDPVQKSDETASETTMSTPVSYTLVSFWASLLSFKAYRLQNLICRRQVSFL